MVPMPVVFVGHGSPMNCVQENPFTQSLRRLAATLPRPQVILCISAHWVTGQGTLVTSNAKPKQIYDFYGFPEELYNLRYEPAGSPELARRVLDLGRSVPIRPSAAWGIDHGTWTILTHIYPDSSIPVVQLSLDARRSPREHYAAALALAPLRSEGVLIIGSGNIVHNLGIADPEQYGAETPDWARAFDAQVHDAIAQRNTETLIDYAKRDHRAARLAVPTNEHYLPLLYCAALVTAADKARYIYEGFQNGSISMRSVVWQQEW